MYHPPVPLILASASPRRAALLAAAGIPFTVRAAEVDETPRNGEPPGDYVVRLALEKARSVPIAPGEVVLGADTTVVIDGRMLGKPASGAEAREMLAVLSGREHEVWTGIALRAERREATATAVSRVRFARLTARDIDWYVASGEPDGKAGAYAIQGLASRFVESVEGSYANVVGLPVHLVCALLRDFGAEAGLAG